LRILILDAGDHARMVAGYFLSNIQLGRPFELVGFLDDNSSLIGSQQMGLPVLGAIEDWHRIEHDALIVAIRDNRTRMRIFEEVARKGGQFISAIHPNAVIGPEVSLGKGLFISAGTVISAGATIGDNVILSSNCVVGHHAQISNHVHVGPCAALCGRVVVGEGTLIGAGASVIPGCRIGRWCVIGAGAAVVSHIPDEVVAVGVPARIKHNTRVDEKG
jgi:acetyltransferase EpsM